MENEHRIYGKETEINADTVKELYNNRAKTMGTTNPYTSVLLGDQNPEYAEKWNAFEKEHILPMLDIVPDDRVLDIGCGIGRWAETLIPLCSYYCGTDFSSEMIKLAQQRIRIQDKSYDFVNCSFQDILENVAGRNFTKVIIAGVCMYINDKDLRECFASLKKMLAPNARLYLTETVAIEERLTLNNFYSAAMKTDYNVIYRTAKQYNDVYETIGGKVLKQDFLPHLNKEHEYSETDRWYTLLQV